MVSARHATVDLSEQRDWTCLLGAITVLGDRFFSRFEEYVTPVNTDFFILTLPKYVKDNLFVVLDGAPYFQASVVTDI
jgi:hypothetical protein